MATETPKIPAAVPSKRDARRYGSAFDVDWYIWSNSDVPRDPDAAASHFMTHGLVEGRSPHPFFDAAWYLNRNPDVAASDIPPARHFLDHGLEEGRSPHPFFEPEWYRRQNPEVSDKGISAVSHFLEHGLPKGLSPHPFFDPNWYLRQNPDAAESGLSAVMHFLTRGYAEGRSPHPFFDAGWYLYQNPDVAAGELPASHQLIAYGLAEGRSPHPLFDPEWYLRKNPDVAGSALTPLRHFVLYGLAEGRSPHPIFDADWYQLRHPDIANYDTSALVFFLENGLRRGDVPGPLFNKPWYIENYLDMPMSDMEPLEHYILYGYNEGRSPTRLFNEDWYRISYEGEIPPSIPAFLHFIRQGQFDLRNPNPLFDSNWYADHYKSDLRKLCPFEHYLRNGDNRPNRAFDATYVAKQIQDLEASCRSTPTTKQEGRAKNENRSSDKIVFTSIVPNQLPEAILLASSVKRHFNDVHFVIVLSDEAEDLQSLPPDCVDEIISARDLWGIGFERWAFMHDAAELRTAIKGVALKTLINRVNCKHVIYLDPDIVMYDRPHPIYEALRNSSIVLTPHLLSPEQEKPEIEQNELYFLRRGIFNSGFLAVSSDEVGRRFADWWCERLTAYCYSEETSGLFLDQKWIDLAPAFFEPLCILRHPGCNATPWNCAERQIRRDADFRYVVNDQALIFFHFAGYQKSIVSPIFHRRRTAESATALLIETYLREVAAVSATVARMSTWKYASYENGQTISPDERRFYRSRLDLQARFPNPFAVQPDQSFLHWYKRTPDLRINASITLKAPWTSYGTVLAGYLAHVLTDNIWPNVLFNPEYYRSAYTDVRTSSLDAFSHFLKIGIAQGRRTSQDFDPLFYGHQIGSMDPESAFWRALEQGIEADARPTGNYLPTRDNDIVDALKLRLDRGLPSVLMINLYDSRGLSKHILELISLNGTGANFLCLSSGPEGYLSLELADKSTAPLLFDRQAVCERLVDVLLTLPIGKLHIHHAFGLNDVISSIVARLGVPYDITLHDFYFLTPNPKFRHSDNARDKYGLDDAMRSAPQDWLGRNAPNDMDLIEWRAQFRQLLRGADRLIAASNFIAQSYSDIDPSIQPIVVPNIDPLRNGFPLEERGYDGADPFCVAVLGDITPLKGAAIISQCAIVSRSRHLPLKFLVIGEAPLLVKGAGVPVTGHYEDDQLPNLLLKHRVNAIWISSEAPEGYSYVLSAALQSGLPVIATDVGCFAERTRGYPQVYMASVDSRSTAWLDLMLIVRRNLLDEVFTTRPFGGHVDAFYRDTYISSFDVVAG